MFHFGLEKGVMTTDKNMARIYEKVQDLRMNLTETFNFIFAKLDVLMSFMDFGMDEVKRIAQQSILDEPVIYIIEFITKFRTNCQEFLVFVMQEVFGEQINPNNLS